MILLLAASVLALVALLAWMESSRRAHQSIPLSENGEVLGRPVALDEKSIAVLPLENLSAQPEDAFFADGI